MHSLKITFGTRQMQRFDLEGVKNVLNLRAEVEGQWGGRAPSAEKYFDSSYHEQALAKVK
jgi:hypothetical protein